MSIGEIDDAEALVPKPDGTVEEKPAIIGTAIGDYIAHRFYRRAINLALCIHESDATDAAH